MRILLTIDGLLMAVIGFLFLFDVTRFARSIAVTLDTPRGIIDFRATYGGLDLAVGLFFLWCAYEPASTRAGLLCATLVFGGLLVTRAAGLAMQGADSLMLQLLAAEVVLTALNGYYFWRAA